MNRKSVAEAKMPEELTPAMKIEFNVLKSKLTELETQWFRLLDNENPDQKRYGEIVDQEYQSMISHANKLAEVRVNSINAQYNEKKKKIMSDYEENKRLLFNRVMYGYHSRYQLIVNRLRELIGPEFDSFLASKNDIEFPQISSNAHNERNISQPDDLKLSMSHHEIERQILKMQKLIEAPSTPAEEPPPPA
ncbi:hypothetical protein M9Y10_005024 [Tritrichomonas musculus]|uniref:Uncharacterized protein n=1 Tax=Tritrichomonas musculus TaxID=1915356 RepID=A0ABR2JKB0_9EUKA